MTEPFLPSAELLAAEPSHAFDAIRRFTQRLAAPLTPEDCTVQSIPDASPTRWHLAHTTWFFEAFVLDKLPGYRPFDARFGKLFNSYYNGLGEPFARAQRGTISRPDLATILEYRRYVDEHILALLDGSREVSDDLLRLIELGVHHEQQHQELILTDIKHALSLNPLAPIYREGRFISSRGTTPGDWVRFDGGARWIGHDGDGFAYDNEFPRHRAYLGDFELRATPVTCGEYLKFIDAGGYREPSYWLSLGWQQVCDHGWTAPLYWRRSSDGWREFTLAGMRDVDPSSPVCHVSYFEADAFARWAGARLPTEAEWEAAAAQCPVEGCFADVLLDRAAAIHPASASAIASDTCGLQQLFGGVWEWTSSSYAPYPGYRPAAGAIGEYNGKFMCNQYILRGGSCATPQGHVRATYRNFFPPEARWQFSGVRLCRDTLPAR